MARAALGLVLGWGVLLLLSTAARAQQPYYQWRLGGGVGTMAYYGDLSYRTKTTQFTFPAYHLFLEKRVSPSFGIQLNGSLGRISANDRTRNWKGDLVTDNPDFGRALNFRTDIRSASLVFNYHFDNGKLFSKYSTFAPYVFVGAGVTNFAVYGDLLNAAGGRYYYWTDNTIRNQPEGPGNQESIVEQDGTYETNLTGLNTEKSYPTTVFSLPAGVGLKIKLADQLSANVQVGATYAFTDYLDDVSGTYPATQPTSELQAYAANPSGVIRELRGEGKSNHDWYFSSFVTLTYHFGYPNKPFKAPLVYTGYHGTASTAATPSANRTKIAVPGQLRPRSDADTLATTDSISVADRLATRPDSVVPQPMATATAPLSDSLTEQLTARPADRNQASPTRGTVKAATPDTTTSAIPYSPATRQSANNLRTDSLRSSVQAQTPANARTTTATRTQSQPEPPVSRTATRERELDDRRRESYRSAYSSPERYPSRTYSQRYSSTTDRNPERRSSQTYVPIPIPLGSGNRNSEQLQGELKQTRSQLLALQEQQGTRDSATTQQLDSLLQLVARLDSQAVARATPDSLAGQPRSPVDSTLIDSLLTQMAALNQSVAALKGGNRTGGGSLKNYGNVVIYYGVNKAALTPADQQRLLVIADKLKSDAGVKLNIKGFTDKTGNPAYNLQLSKRRAENIVRYLTETQSVDPRQILVNYYGQSKRVPSKKRSNPYQRRVELQLFRD